MLVTSSAYLIFLAGLFLLYWPLARWRLASLSLIPFANLFFYAKWDVAYLALIPSAAAIDYLIGLGLARWKNPMARRGLLGASLLLNVGILVVCKYAAIFPLAIGVSFYAFQAMSYTIDLYRRDAKPISSLLTYVSAVSFFPTILAGPITRPASLAPQLDRVKSLLPIDGGRALFLIGLGMAKKFLIADYLGENLVNRVFDTPNLFSGLETLVAVYAYAFQLYYDFSGYTDIALGSAQLLGLKLPPNFNVPYAAQSLADFWRRWHISLSSWLRDYVYFAFPGLRGSVMPYIALIATMLIGGVWHGSGSFDSLKTFIVWGALHGVGLAVVRAWQSKVKWAMPPIAAALLTFHFVCFAWILFRAPNLDGASKTIERIGSWTAATENLPPAAILVLAIAALAHFVPTPRLDQARDFFAARPFFVQAAALVLLMIGIQYVAATGAAPFIYTRF